MEDFDWLEQGQKGRHKNTSKHFRGYWAFDKCHEESLKYGTASEFQRGNSSAYQAAVKNHWIEKLF